MGMKCSLLEPERYKSNTLDYVSASHGGWGIVRMAAQIPEIHILFVCPSACGRHNAIGSAVFKQKDRVHYLYLDSQDIIGSNLEKIIVEGMDELFETLGFKPPAILIFTSCIDDLMGTDHESILASLSMKHPDTFFRHCTMNPISLDTPMPPGITTNAQMYSLIERSHGLEREKAVNIIGTNVSFREKNDLKQILWKHGYRVRHISDYRSFSKMQEMSRSVLNIVTSPVSKIAASEMKRKLEIPYLISYVNYDPEEIRTFYEHLSEVLGENLVEESEKYRKKAEERINEVQKKVGNYPVAMDYQAVLRPYSLAKMLVTHGFNVRMIASDNISPIEYESFSVLRNIAPDIIIENPLSHESVMFPHKGEEYLCIGVECGYMTDSDKVLNLIEDTGLYVYDGILLLMDGIEKAYEGGANIKKQIKEAGLII